MLGASKTMEGRTMPASMTQLFIHYVWGTWQRMPWLEGDVRDIAYRTILAKCKAHGVQVLALDGIEDHVHLLVKIPPTITIAKLIADVKGASSYIINRRRPDDIFKWQDGYGAFTVSKDNLPAAITYIQNQEIHHHSTQCRAITSLDD
jgi:putative transposase